MSEHLQYVARIFVPTSGDRGNNGTAYPIAPNRVITAAHVLDGWDKNRLPELWWNQHPKSKSLNWQAAELKWDGREEKIDVAILEASFPESISGYAPLSLRTPKFEQSFESRGFPAIGKKDDTRAAVPITGEVIQYSPIDKEVSLGIKFGVKEGQDREDALDWKGASGSPVIIDGRFVAVLANCPIGFGAKRTQAIPFCSLAQNHAFFDAIEFTADLEQLERIRAERREQVIHELRKLLSHRENLAEGLLDTLRQENVNTSEADNKVALSDRAEALASLLVETTPKSSLQALLAVTQGRHKSFQRVELDAIRSIVELVLPVTIDRIDSATRLAKQKNDLLALQAASRTMAELAIASLENREARFAQPDVESQNLPPGERYLPVSMLVAPEPGPGKTVDDQANSVIRHLARKTRVGNKSIMPEEATNYDLPDVIDILRECLRELRKDGGALYFALRMSEDKDGRLNQTAIVVKQRVRELAVISLQGDGRDYLREFESLRALRDLLQQLAQFAADGQP